MTLWGAKVNSNKPVILESTENRALSVTRAALVRGSEAVLNVEIDGNPFSLGTLRKDKKSNFELDLNVWEGTREKYSVSVTGQGSEVHLTGYYHPPAFNELVDDDDSSDIEDEIPDDLKKFAQKPKKITAGKVAQENNVTKEEKKRYQEKRSDSSKIGFYREKRDFCREEKARQKTTDPREKEN